MLSWRSNPTRHVLIWLLLFVAIPLSAAEVIWVDDALPAGAIPDGIAEGWSWWAPLPPPPNPPPNEPTSVYSFDVAHVSNNVSQVHQHFFYGASATLSVGAGDKLFAYVYLDPLSSPTSVMLQWNNGDWEHRAYWGADQLPWGTNGTNSKRYMGPLPATGKWVRLEVPASLVGLEGSTLNGMAFSLYNGRAWWDRAGKMLPGAITMNIAAHPVGSKNPNFRIQATGFSVSQVANTFRLYGTAGYQQLRWNASLTGHDNLFHGTAAWPDGQTVDNANRSDCAHTKDPRLWDARCATDSIGYFWKNITCPGGGVACENNDRWNASPGTYNVTPFPAVGVWPRTDDFGTSGYTPIIGQTNINSVQLQPADTNCVKPAGDMIWVGDVLPRQAVPQQLNDSWTWVNTASVSPSPQPFASSRSIQSGIVAGVHQVFFTGTAAPLVVNPGESLTAWVYLDPQNPPTSIMLQWNDGDWNQRAFWGADQFPWGTYGTDSRRPMGNLPATGQWVRLEVPASQVGLSGATINGMAFSLFNGRAWWDHAGKHTPAVVTGQCPPKTGRPQQTTYHAYNPDEYATGSANAKAVQVFYNGGVSRWFMAFNSMIKRIAPTQPAPTGNPTNFGRNPDDNWRILWATSSDGVNWSVHPQVLLRSTRENSIIWGGVLMVDMIIDNGYFYILFTDLVSPQLYLARSPIDPFNTNPGYSTSAGWTVASYPLVGGQYTWKSVPLGSQINFDTLTAYPVMPTIQGLGGPVKQGAIARVFRNATANSESKYFGVTNDKGGAVQLWSTTDLTRPFTYDSHVYVDPSVGLGANGWEFGFTHYSDNLPATPRIYSSLMTVWVGEIATANTVLITRRNATLTNW